MKKSQPAALIELNQNAAVEEAFVAGILPEDDRRSVPVDKAEARRLLDIIEHDTGYAQRAAMDELRALVS